MNIDDALLTGACILDSQNSSILLVFQKSQSQSKGTIIMLLGLTVMRFYIMDHQNAPEDWLEGL